MKVNVWNPRKRSYEAGDLVSQNDRCVVVRVGLRTFEVQPNDIEGGLTQRAADGICTCGAKSFPSEMNYPHLAGCPANPSRR